MFAQFSLLVSERKSPQNSFMRKENSITFFKNKAKAQATADVYVMKDKCPEMRKMFIDVDSLTELKFHLAKNRSQSMTIL